VYCLEAVDNPRHRLDDLTIDAAVVPKVAPADETLGGAATIRTAGRVRPRTGASWWPYSFARAVARDELGGAGRGDRGPLLHLGKPRARRDADLGAHRLGCWSMTLYATSRDNGAEPSPGAA
jgi:hypothetical protein